MRKEASPRHFPCYLSIPGRVLRLILLIIPFLHIIQILRESSVVMEYVEGKPVSSFWVRPSAEVQHSLLILQ